MPSKKLVILLAVVGSTIGSYIPSLFGAGFLSFTSLLAGAAGGILGIWLAFRISK